MSNASLRDLAWRVAGVAVVGWRYRISVKFEEAEVRHCLEDVDYGGIFNPILRELNDADLRAFLEVSQMFVGRDVVVAELKGLEPAKRFQVCQVSLSLMNESIDEKDPQNYILPPPHTHTHESTQGVMKKSNNLRMCIDGCGLSQGGYRL